MANYTDTTKVAQFLQRSLTTNETSALTGYILAAVDKWIDRKLESHFGSVSETTRYYEGGGHTVDLDPVQSVTAVVSQNNDGSASYDYTENSEFVLEPVNEDVKRELVYRGRHTRYPSGLRRIAVTGKFTEYDYANSEVPADIVLAATQLAAGILNGGKKAGTGANVASESLEGHSISYDTSASVIESLADADPVIQGMLGERREIYIY